MVCIRQAQALEARKARQVGEADVDTAALIPTVTIVKSTTVIAATVTSTIPGINAACPTTDTVTVTQSRSGYSAQDPYKFCGRALPPDCSCGGGPRATSTLVEVHTISQTETVFVTKPPMRCRPIPTPPPLDGREDVSMPLSTECATYATQWEEVLCYDGSNRAVTAAPPAPTAAAAVQSGLPLTKYTSDCTVHIVYRSAQCLDLRL
ncbi:hypothetical protein SPBR_07869 [Sporothrix brasiliensis 5110]|uniref:Uncharacterized protein n=1 Tax=Sporothrix brasiliensis 5110 TaxID=1398154 RepID=A0A0C2ESN0_9PEZI|nr:uncharacterized protein SPBR_07869 [Sporothrix brasiliensis 5110]KIH89389.1 hypothetical protein SPBR_07869 [Sporothrix brasiliensis 5110]